MRRKECVGAWGVRSRHLLWLQEEGHPESSIVRRSLKPSMGHLSLGRVKGSSGSGAHTGSVEPAGRFWTAKVKGLVTMPDLEAHNADLDTLNLTDLDALDRLETMDLDMLRVWTRSTGRRPH